MNPTTPPRTQEPSMSSPATPPQQQQQQQLQQQQQQQPSSPPPSPPPPRVRHGLAASFRFAFAGIGYLFRTQRNARIHAAVAVVVCALAAWLRVSRAEWAVLILTIACVLILEGLNTALEAVVDLASPQIHPLAKVAKDVAAGMVLIAALAAAAIGLLILGPPLWARLAL